MPRHRAAYNRFQQHAAGVRQDRASSAPTPEKQVMVGGEYMPASAAQELGQTAAIAQEARNNLNLGHELGAGERLFGQQMAAREFNQAGIASERDHNLKRYEMNLNAATGNRSTDGLSGEGTSALPPYDPQTNQFLFGGVSPGPMSGGTDWREYANKPGGGQRSGFSPMDIPQNPNARDDRYVMESPGQMRFIYGSRNPTADASDRLREPSSQAGAAAAAGAGLREPQKLVRFAGEQNPGGNMNFSQTAPGAEDSLLRAGRPSAHASDNRSARQHLNNPDSLLRAGQPVTPPAASKGSDFLMKEVNSFIKALGDKAANLTPQQIQAVVSQQSFGDEQAEKHFLKTVLDELGKSQKPRDEE